MSQRIRLLFLILALALAALACRGSRRPELKFSPETLPDAQAGQPYSITVSVSQNDTPVGDLWVEAGQLPPGLELVFTEESDAAEIRGTPEQAGAYTFTLSAWCYGTNISGQTGQKEYVITVK